MDEETRKAHQLDALGVQVVEEGSMFVRPVQTK
jgi:hypothetical protein